MDTMSTKQSFADTVHCLSRAHCATCRNLEEGRNWRKSLVSLFVLPNNEIDFKCPYGKDWGDSGTPPPPPQPRPTPKMAARPTTAITPTGVQAIEGGCGCSRRKAAAAKGQK